MTRSAITGSRDRSSKHRRPARGPVPAPPRCLTEIGYRDPENQRLPLDTPVRPELRRFQAMSTAELAAIYEVPVGAIKSRLSQARELLATATKLT